MSAVTSKRNDNKNEWCSVDFAVDTPKYTVAMNITRVDINETQSPHERSRGLTRPMKPSSDATAAMTTRKLVIAPVWHHGGLAEPPPIPEHATQPVTQHCDVNALTHSGGEGNEVGERDCLGKRFTSSGSEVVGLGTADGVAKMDIDADAVFDSEADTVGAPVADTEAEALGDGEPHSKSSA